MTNYLQDTESKYTQELIDAKIVAPNGEVLDTHKYIKLLRAHEEHIREQIHQAMFIDETTDEFTRSIGKKIDVAFF